MTNQNRTGRAAGKPKLTIRDLPQPEVQELTPEQAEQAKGGIIAILIGDKPKDPPKSQIP